MPVQSRGTWKSTSDECGETSLDACPDRWVKVSQLEITTHRSNSSRLRSDMHARSGFRASDVRTPLIRLIFTEKHGSLELFPDCRQTAPYSPELEPDIVLTQPHASGVNETCTPLVIAEGGSIPLRRMTTARYRHAADERKRES